MDWPQTNFHGGAFSPVHIPKFLGGRDAHHCIDAARKRSRRDAEPMFKIIRHPAAGNGYTFVSVLDGHFVERLGGIVGHTANLVSGVQGVALSCIWGLRMCVNRNLLQERGADTINGVVCETKGEWCWPGKPETGVASTSMFIGFETGT